ncbi:FHA domain-containing protein, partial [Streptomyces sp. NPDC006450]|uniref:FHA domain-containing protein n=1 Tax=Streptomyces sp. NPDC006450 TaxID=3155458 RepID=UPI0033B062F2
MQIRLTVLGSGSRSGHQTATATASGGGTGGGGAPASCDVLVTAPAGTALSAVASGLAATVGGPDTGGTVVLYAGPERLDPARCALGEPPLVDGAVLSLNVPGPDVRADGTAAATVIGDGPQLHVVAGPDAGGVHLLHPGAIRIGRSADADVPLDDPDVSRLHCTVTVLPDGRVAVADLGSTNGTTLDGAVVGAERVALAPGALLRVGESTLRLAVGPGPAPLPLTPDLEGHLSVPLPGPHPDAAPGHPDSGHAGAAPGSAAGSHPEGGTPDGAWVGAAPDTPAASHPAGGAPGGAWNGGAYPDAGSPGTQGQIPRPSPHWDGSAPAAPAAPGAGQHAAGGWGAPGSAPSDPWPYGGTDQDGEAGSPRAGRIARPASAPGAAGAGAGQYGRAGAGAGQQTGVEHHGADGWEEPEPARSADTGAEARRGGRRGIGAWARKWVRGAEAAEAEEVADASRYCSAAPRGSCSSRSR